MATGTSSPNQQAQLRSERRELLDNIIALTRTPMTVLSFIWVGLVIANFASHLPEPLQWFSLGIWGLFVLDFLVQMLIAPSRVAYLRQNWLTAISLALPAFSMLRLLQALRLMRLAALSGSFSMLRIVAAANRGMEAIRRVLGHRKLGYVVALTMLVTLAGAAGMFALERPEALRAQGFGTAAHGGAGIHSYAEAVWWTAMMMTTIGSAYWPLTVPGRILCFFLAFYALSVFGYITASVASYFIGGHTSSLKGGQGAVTDMSSLESELAAMREQLAVLVAQLDATEH